LLGLKGETYLICFNLGAHMNKGKFPHDKKHQKPQWPGHAGIGPQKPPHHNPGHPGHNPQGNPNKPEWPNKDKR